MQYICLHWWIILSSIQISQCWQYFTSLSNVVRSNPLPDEGPAHSQYMFGDCLFKHKRLYKHVRIDYSALMGKIIMRGWIDIPQLPTCIILRATAYESEMFKTTAFQFQICVTRLTYCHTQEVTHYYYYEWFIPPDMISGMDWDIYFSGY